MIGYDGMHFISQKFQGRIDRKTFSLPVSFIVLLPYAYFLITGVIILGASWEFVFLLPLVTLYIIFDLPWLLPLLSLIYLFILPIIVRRLHDIGWSGRSCLLVFISNSPPTQKALFFNTINVGLS